MQTNRKKPISIWLSVATLVVINLFVALFEHPYSYGNIPMSIIMLFGVIRYNMKIKQMDTENEIIEDERTIQNRNRYNQILLFWSIIIVLAVLAILLLNGIKSVSIEHIILAFCIILLGGFTFNSYLSKKK
ncbi:hypothetical protein [Lysinibacillus sp. NPDC093216]|uniref:hypothetical protein n=1 Tax=Lysinibacillus sp. NPDC093216 TaxID=3390576 RepID=UPI003D030DA4